MLIKLLTCFINKGPGYLKLKSVSTAGFQAFSANYAWFGMLFLLGPAFW